MTQQSIRIKGARQHNLRNLDVSIPRNKLVVITGPSGSGKSSLAFDTLFAEGQRRYVESLSAYARQFLDRMQKPEVDHIEGLSPAIAIEQRIAPPNPRSTIATTTEIYDYLRVLYASVGVPHDPVTGAPVRRQSPQQIGAEILSWTEGTRLMLLAPLVTNEAGEFRDVIDRARREGFVRLRIDGEIIDLGRPEPVKLLKTNKHTIEAVVDRVALRSDGEGEGLRERLLDSLETSLRHGGNTVIVLRQGPGSELWEEKAFSTDFRNPETGFTMPRLTPRHFSFNSHLGACPACQGLGTEPFCDSSLIVDEDLPLLPMEKGAIRPWRTPDKRMGNYYRQVLEALCNITEASAELPFRDLPVAFKEKLFHGTSDEQIPKLGKGFEGLVPMVERQMKTSESELKKNRLKAFFARKPCSLCGGTRIRAEILGVTITGPDGREWNIDRFCSLPAAQALSVMSGLQLSPTDRKITSDLLREITARLRFLVEVGLGYLTLNRESGTLSGGEAQRIRLATQIGSGLAGVLYVLDEPSIGLHQRDNNRLLATLRGLRDLGNSVVVVEHDEETILAADHILDMGPGAGPRGGEIVAEGTPAEILAHPKSLTGQFLSGRERISVPRVRQRPPVKAAPGPGWLTVTGASENNLKNLTIGFPVGLFTVVTGVSGSGKSTLVNDILHRALARQFHGAREVPGAHGRILGAEAFDKVVVIDQSPIGRTPRSNPATYSGVFGPIRDLFSGLPAAKVRGYGPARFSCNVKGGRCEQCEGDGMIRIEMHFLADVFVECELCRGRRFNRETLEISYKGKNIADVLELTIDEAAGFFRAVPQIHGKLEVLQEVGLGYLKLGQSATTLSGGEAQRLKLASELSRKATGRTLYLLDEPTTGLHFADIQKLLEVLLRLRDGGNTLIMIEHNLEVIKCADWIIDMGPEGGDAGGSLVVCGTPDEVAEHASSHTGSWLRRVLRR
ncbi:MAG: excinuclease ABC subunit UvrA [Proteobacteria bacterium]|nr:excinuclease ABC subunit UvrA [Pseudomonadota bacterium]